MKTIIETAIDNKLDGASLSDVMEDLSESISDTMKMRRVIKKESPKLYKFMAEAGILQDFAADVLTLPAKRLKSKYQVPSIVKQELESLAANVERMRP